MNEKMLLNTSGKKLQIPNSFIDADLTIAVVGDNHGYGCWPGSDGDLLPSRNGNLRVTTLEVTNNGSVSVTLVKDGVSGVYFGAFFYNNQVYRTKETHPALLNEWKKIVGKTVKVIWGLDSDLETMTELEVIQLKEASFSGSLNLGGRKPLPLHACNSLWRAAA